jgi:hypothetical protein
MVLLQTVLWFLFMFSCHCVDMSGFYYDNGKGQTVLQSRLDPRQSRLGIYSSLFLFSSPISPSF